MRYPTNRLAAGTLALAAAFAASSAHATGVDAGTLIENTASASFSIGTTTATVDSNTVTLKVDELLNVAVASNDSSPVLLGAPGAVLSYTITNTGNGPEAFVLAANPTVSGNDFDAVVQSIVIDSNGNGVYDAGVDAVLASGAPTPLLAADEALVVFVVVTLPSGAAAADTSQVRLTADADTGTGAPGTVFDNAGQGGGDAVVGTSTASQEALGSLLATLVNVSLTKSASISDPFGGAQPVPGATITYTLALSVTGNGAAGNLHITDVIPAGTSYKTNSLILDSAGLTDLADGDEGTGSASGIDVSLGSVAAGSSHTVQFSVTIN
jgi:uncharacterized repeat protein (TIGR01451 family)